MRVASTPMPSDWSARRKEREERLRRLTDEHVTRLRRELGIERPKGRRVRRVAMFAGFCGLLGLAWWAAPQLSGVGDTIESALDDRLGQAEERLEGLGDEVIADVEERTGRKIDISDRPIEVSGSEVEGWALPLASVDGDRAVRPHHTYPAWDYGTRVGTPVYAMTFGTITTALDDDGGRCGGTVTLTTFAEGAEITYCHLSEVAVDRSMTVGPGELLGATGGQPGDPGAGNTSGPHLHLQIRLDGRLLCPQSQFVAIFGGAPLPVRDLADEGCFYNSSSLAGVGDVDLDSPLFRWDDGE